MAKGSRAPLQIPRIFLGPRRFPFIARLPIAILGMLASGRLFNRIDPALWKRGIAGFLIMAALLNLLRFDDLRLTMKLGQTA